MRTLLALVAAALLLLTPRPFAARTVCDPERFGAVAHLAWSFFYRSPEEIARGLGMMRDAGIGWVRLNWSWKDFQPEPGPFEFENFDTVARLANEYDIELLPILITIPAWASTAPAEMIARLGDLAPVDRYRPDDLTDWLTYVRTVVERYDGDGIEDAPGSPRLSHWEVWNEPNLALYWVPEVNAVEYAEFLAITHETIKGADPTATVVLGGLSGSGVNNEGTGFLQQLYAAGAGAAFDVVGVHHYVHPARGSITGLREALEATRRVMDENGDEEKPLWLTEIGWSDAPEAWGQPTATREEIAAWLVQVYTTPLPVEKIFWYNFRNLDVTDQVEHNFGLVERDFTPKPAYEAYAAVGEACRG